MVEKCNTCHQFPTFSYVNMGNNEETYGVYCKCGTKKNIDFPVENISDVIYNWNEMCRSENKKISAEEAFKEWAHLRCMFWVHENEIPSEFLVVEKYIKQQLEKENGS